MKTIGIVIFDDVEELDFVGPYEVFCMINAVQALVEKPALVDVKLISQDGRDITGVNGMRVGAHASFADINALDVLVVPGGMGTRPQLENKVMIDWIAKIGAGAEWVTSVCTGAFLLSKAGFSKNKRMASYWGAFEEFSKRGLEGTLVPEVRYVRDGNLVTSAGVSAGIDMSLWLTGQMFTPDLARTVQKGMQYDPAPPYTGDV